MNTNVLTASDFVKKNLRFSMLLNADVNSVAGNNKVHNALEIVRVIAAQGRFILEELRETLEATDMTEVRDGIADVIVTCDGMLHRLPYDDQCVAGSYAGVEDATNTAGPRSIAMEIDGFRNLCELADSILTEEPTDEQAGNLMSATLKLLTTTYATMFFHARDVAKLSTHAVALDQYAVYVSNMSKFDLTVEDAQATAATYAQKGIQVEIVPTMYKGIHYYVVKSSVDQTVGDKFYPRGKFLKSIHFQKPLFT